MRDFRNWVGIVLATGLVFALNTITIAVLWDALHGESPGLSENATQILTGAFGGVIGILGSMMGYQAASNRKDREGNHDLE